MMYSVAFSRRVRPGRDYYQKFINKSGRLASSISSNNNKEVRQLPASWGSVHEDIIPHIQGRSTNPEDIGHYEQRDLTDTGFHVQFPGTGSGSTNRASSCTLVRVGTQGCLFDVGEGTQRQVQKTKFKMHKINRIFITHMHGDHVLGLPSLLLGSNFSNLSFEDSTLHIYGPAGIYNFIIAAVALTCSKISMKVEVHELLGSKAKVNWRKRGIHGNLPQFRNSNIIRKTIEPGNDGIWLLREFEEVTRDSTVYRPDNIRISAAELRHVPNVQTMGYVIEEAPPPLRIDTERAIALGVEPGPKCNELKNGFPVMNDEGTREVHPEEVLYDDGKKGRKIAILGDLCAVPPPMERLCKNADVVVHEATLLESDHWKSVKRGHSTASMAGRLADSANVDLLVLNHHNAYADHGDSQAPSREAERVIQRSGTRVLSACDFMELAIPREGFRFAAEEASETAQLQSTAQDGSNEKFIDRLLPKEDEFYERGILREKKIS